MQRTVSFIAVIAGAALLAGTALAADKIRAAGLPLRLAARLLTGH